MNKRNIGLIDVDGTGNFPDLALMKLSAWHKKNGDEVEWYTIFGDYDIVYMSKVFTHTPDFGEIITNAKEIRRGQHGTRVGCLEVLQHEPPLRVPYPRPSRQKDMEKDFAERCPPGLLQATPRADG